MTNIFRYFYFLLFILIYECSYSISLFARITQLENFQNFDVKFYFIDIELDNQSAQFNAKATIVVEMKAKVSEVLLDMKSELTIDSLFINNISKKYTHKKDQLIIKFEDVFEAADQMKIEVYYHLHETLGSESAGIFNKASSTGKKVTYSLTEPYNSLSWYPCKMDLNDKADSVWVFITIPDTLKAGSNGLLTAIVPLAENKVRYEWKSNYPTAFYLISVSVANYLDYSFKASTTNGDSVLVKNYIYNDSTYLRRNKDAIDKTAELIELFSGELGPYPFRKEKYGHCLAPLGGGMEHQTMTTLNGFNFELVAHELGHQWFGDYVTCASWQDIWINEGFASYCEYLALEKLKSESAQAWLNYAHDLAKTYPDGSVYVPLELLADIDRIFNYELTYRKGASIIHMLRHEIRNDSLFFNVLQNFLNKFSFSSATGQQFCDVASEISGINFQNFFDQWYYGAGYPSYSIQWLLENDSITFFTQQRVSTPSITSKFDLLMDFKLDYYGGDTIISFRIDSLQQNFKFPINHQVYRISPDPYSWLIASFDGITRIFPNNENPLFNLYPNPSNTEIFIENYDLGKAYEIKIMDLNGKIILSKVGEEVFTQIPIHQFQSGNYQVIVSQADRTEIFKLIKF